jgi:hypothetical protein
VAADERVAVAATEVQVQVGTEPWAPLAGPLVAKAGWWYRFRARSTDTVGNVSPWATSAWTMGVRDDPPAAPVVPPTAPDLQTTLDTPAEQTPPTDPVSATPPGEDEAPDDQPLAERHAHRSPAPRACA